MKPHLRFLVVGLLIMLGHSALADVPKQMNFQGVLSDSLGDPLVDTTISVDFTIYDALTGGTSKWTENQFIVTDDQGRFSVILGIFVPIEDSVFKGTERFLAIKVGSDPALEPRTKLVSSPYAERVATVDGATGGTLSGSVEVIQVTPSASPTRAISAAITNTSSGDSYGGQFSSSAVGTGSKIGVRGDASSLSLGVAYGIYGEADNGSVGNAFGGYFNCSTGGPGGTGYHYGIYAGAYGMGGPVYGGYFYTDTTGIDTKYGVYSVAPTSEGWAGYFQGNVRVSDTLWASSVSSLSPLLLQTAGTTRVYIDDVTGNVGVGTSAPQSALQVASGYIQLPVTTSPPPPTDCDRFSERGRMKFDAASGTLYICTGVTGWITK